MGEIKKMLRQISHSFNHTLRARETEQGHLINRLERTKILMRFMNLSEEEKWSQFLRAARRVLSDEEINLEIGASTKTLNKWVSGLDRPGPVTQRLTKGLLLLAIKDKLDTLRDQTAFKSQNMPLTLLVRNP